MKRTMNITGIFAAVCVALGAIFKTQHWPGANIMMVSGVVLISFIFLPLMFTLKFRESKDQRDKLILVLGCVISILIAGATMCKLMHWPLGGLLTMVSIYAVLLVFVPVYLFTGIRNPDAKLNTIVNSVLIIAGSGLLMSLSNQSPSMRTIQVKMSEYVESENLLHKIQSKADHSPVGDAVNQLCDQIKEKIIENELGVKFIPADFEKQNLLMEEHSVGYSLLEKGSDPFSDLKTAVEKYNSLVSDPAARLELAHSVLDLETDKLAMYSNYLVLNSINQLQMELAEKGLN